MNDFGSQEAVIAAVATPQGRGALGVVRLSGPGAVGIAASLITLAQDLSLEALPPRQAALGVFHQNGTRIDRVVATVYRAPHSYTGEDLVEVSCHGGPAVLRSVLDLFLKAGARPAEPGEFSRRAFLNGKMDLAQAEAVADLIHAETELARAAAFDQLEGRLSGEILAQRDDLLEVLAHLEVEIDHSDDNAVGVPQSRGERRARLEKARQALRRLEASYGFGRLLREGLRIAIVGKPNAGKSSLLNRLVKTDRSIVTAQPGTTRDTIEEGFDLLGLPALLVDTAGLREGVADAAERLGIERSRRALEKADAALVVLDASAAFSEEDASVAELASKKERVLVVLNKSDLPARLTRQQVAKNFPKAPQVAVSTLTGAGVEDLLQALRRLAGEEGPDQGQVWVTSLRHREALARAAGALDRALGPEEEDALEECLALELREALDALGTLVGGVATEDLLGEIFSKFCIGK